MSGVPAHDHVDIGVTVIVLFIVTAIFMIGLVVAIKGIAGQVGCTTQLLQAECVPYTPAPEAKP